MAHSTEDFPYLQKFVRADWIDLRDTYYEPALTVLNAEVLPSPEMRRDARSGEAVGPKEPAFGVRSQGNSGRCAGFALASLIDFQRRDQHRVTAGSLKSDDIVSADMLYRMAAYHDQYPDLSKDLDTAVADFANRPEGIRSLRSVIKGLYHHGVCKDLPPDACPDDPAQHWQSDCYIEAAAGLNGELQLFPTVPQAKAARSIGLGAYYRLRPILNHFHAVLNDTGSAIVSANVHSGWMDPFNSEAKGIIRWPDDTEQTGTHAFVLIGYDDQGFLVLNSWGANWGGYRGLSGVGLWKYADWAQNVVDSWVLRLAVSTPDAFDISIGEQGANRIYGATRSGSTPCYELVGHYMHLDDGFHVRLGSYPSFEKSWKKTDDYLREELAKGSAESDDVVSTAPAEPVKPAYKGVLVWIPGSLEGIKPAFEAAVRRKNRIKELGQYPYSVFWCNNFVEKSMEVLATVFESCVEQVGQHSDELDALIEQSVRGVGRAFWRDIEQGARRAVHGTPDLPDEFDHKQESARPGHLVEFFTDLFDLVDSHGAELHLVTEGAGALVLHEFLALFDERIPAKHRIELARPPSDYFRTVTLALPAIGLPRARKYILPFIEKINARSTVAEPCDIPKYSMQAKRQEIPEGSAPPPPARIIVPDKELENRIGFATYNKSILHLIARSFEDRLGPTGAEDRRNPMHPPRTFLGMAEAREKLRYAGYCRETDIAFSRLLAPSAPRHAVGKVQQSDISNDPAILAEILRSVETHKKN